MKMKAIITIPKWKCFSKMEIFFFNFEDIFKNNLRVMGHGKNILMLFNIACKQG